MQVRDIKDVLKDAVDPSALGEHSDRDMAHAHSWDSTVIT
jgi:hypothetical protein